MLQGNILGHDHPAHQLFFFLPLRQITFWHSIPSDYVRDFEFYQPEITNVIEPRGLRREMSRSVYAICAKVIASEDRFALLLIPLSR